MNQQNLLKNSVLQALREAVSSYLQDSYSSINISELKIRIEYSRDEKFGDYSSPFALENKNSFGKNPKEIAEALIEKIKNNILFSEVTFSPP